jgi:hypothetical protein
MCYRSKACSGKLGRRARASKQCQEQKGSLLQLAEPDFIGVPEDTTL